MNCLCRTTVIRFCHLRDNKGKVDRALTPIQNVTCLELNKEKQNITKENK